MNPAVEEYIKKLKLWKEETRQIRKLLLDCGLTEELKWRQPCYTFENSNIAIIQGFKEKCALMFFKGALLKDSENILVAPGKNSQAARRIEFSNEEHVVQLGPTIKKYIRAAI